MECFILFKEVLQENTGAKFLSFQLHLCLKNDSILVECWQIEAGMT